MGNENGKSEDPPFKALVTVYDTSRGRFAKIEMGAESRARLAEKVHHRMNALDEYDFFRKEGGNLR
ncbi:hypothetical protein SEA_POKYPUPPY_46 [Gordonia phage PokyPuppy]|nr:hypothetical protein SEA_POKYPUPPY_46 [Gordonia phage PokyPuppy]